MWTRPVLIKRKHAPGNEWDGLISTTDETGQEGPYLGSPPSKHVRRCRDDRSSEKFGERQRS